MPRRDLELEGVTFGGNQAASASGDAVGGGLTVPAGDTDNTVTLTNVTVADNVAASGGDHFPDDGGSTN